jgi:MFS family permease
LIGRKRIFMVTIVITGLATFAVGLLPVYETAGILAPILLVTLRVLQGLALGGEYGGAVIYVTEHVPKNRRGLSTSFIQMTGTLGFLMALLSIQLVQALTSQSTFDNWGWRIPFLISIVFSRRIDPRAHADARIAGLPKVLRLLATWRARFLPQLRSTIREPTVRPRP